MQENRDASQSLSMTDNKKRAAWEDTLPRRPILARVQANPIAVRIRDPRHPAHARLRLLDQDLHTTFAAHGNGFPHVLDGERDAGRAAPVPFLVRVVRG